MTHQARPFVLHEATYRQTRELSPNVAVLPWGATEAHNFHLPHGTDVIEAVALGEAAVERANHLGARAVLLPCIPFGIDHSQLSQTATITMRGSTQQAVLTDIAQSLVRQGIDRLVLLNFHGGNEFKSMIRDVMFDLPIFIVQVHGYALDPAIHVELGLAPGEHADEFETSLLLHLCPQWVADLGTAGDGAVAASRLPAVTGTPGVWSPRDWAALTRDTGVGNPHAATADKGRQVLERLATPLAKVLIELSRARPGDFPFVIRPPELPPESSPR